MPDANEERSGTRWRRFLPTTALLLLLVLFFEGCAVFDPAGRGAGFFDTVVIDAGHGGHDRGARSVSGLNEKDLALDVALRLKPLLERRGFRVIMTRDSDRFIPLGDRVRFSNRRRNSIFVSIHFNHARRRGAAGIETFYFSRNSHRLAANVQREVLRVYRAQDRGVKHARFHVLRENNRPAILAELGFVSNAEENRLIQNPAHRQRLAAALARGIEAERRGRRP